MARDIIIGDIHGCFDELQRLLADLAVTPADRLISVGDLVDRGPRSAEVWEFFAARPNTVVLMGNHERKHVRGVLSFSQEIVRLQLGDRYDAFVRWASALPYALETPDVLVVHGGFECGVPLSEQREDVLAGTTSGTKHLESLYPGRYWTDAYTGDKPIVFGHHVVGDEVKTWNDAAHGLDTGACHGGYLSALVLPGFEVHRVPAARDYWSEQQAAWQVPVLERRGWAQRSRRSIERELASLTPHRHDGVRAFAGRLRAWLDGLDALRPTLLHGASARLAELRAQHDPAALRRAIADEPMPAVLFAQLSEQLEAQLSALLPTPEAVLQAAAALGVDPGGLERFPDPLTPLPTHVPPLPAAEGHAP